MNKARELSVGVTAVVDSGRLIQKFPYGETNQEHCIHGIKLRWACDDCDDHEVLPDDMSKKCENCDISPKHVAECDINKRIIIEAMESDLMLAHQDIAKLSDELNEQCRLNGMGASREAKLMAKLESARAVIEKDVAARFWSKVEVSSKHRCWDWKSSISPNGYGKFSIANYPHSAHRVSFEFFNGKIPNGLVIDHTCRNKGCVNPNHLRAVTSRTNAIENSDSVSAVHIRKTHCVNGHEFTEQNTKLKKARNGQDKVRVCRSCHNEQVKKNRARKRARQWLKENP